MPSQKQIRRRIVGVKNTGKITRAMKMVAAAKLKRSQHNMELIRPYAWKLRDVIASLAAHTDLDKHPLLATRESQKVGIVSVTSDRGLCGSFNVNISRRTLITISEYSGIESELFCIGRKGYDFFRKRNVPIFQYFPGVFQELVFSQASAVGGVIAEQYVSGEFDRIYLVYNEFKNVVQQNIVCEQLLPIKPFEEMTQWRNLDYIYEPNSETVLNDLLPQYLNIQIWRVLLESFAAEQAARMNAMENATENAKELATSLTLQYNKARQTAITKELLEIVGGAEGLKG